ncbi:MAG: hypothetical protein O2868_04290 [Proteobacteria bacterium]|nr:hypothetical protein [Pseudomonadota bacterium]
MIRSRAWLSATVFSLYGFLYGFAAYGLGTGSLNLDSALNQNFKAEIELINSERLAPEEILPSLASQQDFDRFGVERSYILTDLRFKVSAHPNGDLYIAVTSTRPVYEPFLNFIMELRWPNGRIVKEFTVLLDPPVFGEQGVAPITPVETTPSRVNTATPRQSSQGRPTQSAGRSSPMSEGERVEDEYGVTGPGDTLWNIALKVRPSDSVSVQQTMLALQRLNPEAFINNNINLLKAGHVLRVPSREQIDAESVSSAVDEVRTQNRAFEDYRSSGVAQMDATRRERPGRGQDAGDDGELKLVAANSSSGQRAGDSDGRVAELENTLSVAREDLDRARRANTELNVRLDDLEGQIETLNEIVKLKDDQLAAWKAQLQKMEAGGASAPTEAAPAVPATDGSLLTNPFVLGALALLLIAGAAAGMIFMRKRTSSEVADEPFEEPALNDSPEVMPLGEDVEDVLEDEIEVDEDLTAQTSDPVSEAEIYIAYGRFPQAIEFLRNAIRSEPERVDIQLKLLEVYVQTEDAVAFNLQFDELKKLGDSDANETATALQAQIPGAAETAAASMDATVVSAAPIQATPESDDLDDDDLSFDLDDLDAEVDDDDEMDLGADSGDDLELSVSDDEDLPPLSSEGVDNELSLDDDQFLLDEDESGPDLAAAPTGEDDLDLDGDLDLDLDLGDEDLDLDLDLDLDEADDTGSNELADTQNLADSAVDADLEDDASSLDLSDDDDLDFDLDEVTDESVLGSEAGADDSDDVSLDLDEMDRDDSGLDEPDDGPALSDVEESSPDDLAENEFDLSELEPDEGDDEFDLSELDDVALDDGGDLGVADDDAISLDLDTDDDFDLEAELGLDSEDELSLDSDDELSLDSDDELSLDSDDDGISLDLDDGDDDILADLDEANDLGLDDDLGELDLDEDLGELDLDEDAGSKLDLARAYLDMGDPDGARTLLNEVVSEGTEDDVKAANELLEKLD